MKHEHQVHFEPLDEDQTRIRFSIGGVDGESVPDMLRYLANKMENDPGEVPDTCAVVLAGAGDPVIVYSFGECRDSENLLATLAKGQHCLLTSIMPNGGQSLE